MARSRARSTPEMFLIRSLPEGIPLAVTVGSSGRLAFTCASSSAYPALKRVVRGVSVSWLASALTSENRLDFRKNAMNLSDCRETRFRRMYLAKMITQDTKEKKRRIPEDDAGRQPGVFEEREDALGFRQVFGADRLKEQQAHRFRT